MKQTYFCLIACLATLTGSLVSHSVRGQLRLGEVWQSGMVIQRDQPIRIWGWATPGETVRLRLGKEQQLTTAKADSTWLVTFPARSVSAKGDTIAVQTGTQRIELTDVLVGDVWVCAGQSNMAFQLANDQFAKQTLQQARNPMLRLLNRLPTTTVYNQPYRPKDLPHLYPNQFYHPAHWQPADSLSARLFSAVGYYTGAELQRELAIPIGLIHVAVGGSPAEAWLPVSTQKEKPVVEAMFKGNWFSNAALEAWCIQRGHENIDSLLADGYSVPSDSFGYNHPFKPGFLYQAALQPILQLGLKGILWYQGESYALSLPRVQQHQELFPALISAWRAAWQQPNLPVYFCQLSSIGTERGYKSTYWPLFRDGQRRIADSLAYVGMAVTSDVGHPWDVHPTNKKAVGDRLAREILVKTYGKSRLLSPAVSRIQRRKQEWVVTFSQTGKELRTADGRAVQGFSVGNADGPRQDVTVALTGKEIRLPAQQGGEPVYLYYGWQPFSLGNLVNAEGLPLSTFRIQLP
ncbi:hypothetical protein GCM10027341_29240 [Spirosoma knui]